MKSKYLPTAVRRVLASGEEGNVLIEVMVSAMMITIAAIGVFSAFTAAERSTATERHQAQAHGIAQADIARLRTMRISQLSPSLTETTTKTVEGTAYSVVSDAQYINAKTGTDTCDEKEASADYIRIRSTVTWPGMGSRPAVTETSLVAPPNSTAKAQSGALIVQVLNGEDDPIPGIPISGDGPTPFSRDTGENGCAVFGNLLEGDYEVNATVPDMVDPDGDESGTAKTSVVAEATKTLTLQYDTPGELVATFQARFASSTAAPSTASAQAITLFNTGMEEARVFNSPLKEAPFGAPKLELGTGGSLFPFDDGYTIYAGSCEDNNPDPEGKHPSAAVVQAIVSAGEKTTVTLELPVLRLHVYKGTTTGSESAAGVEVSVRDTNCTTLGLPSQKFTTDSKGVVNIALPFSRVDATAGLKGYTACALGKASDSNYRRYEKPETSVPASATNVPGGTELNLFLRSGTTVDPTKVKCP